MKKTHFSPARVSTCAKMRAARKKGNRKKDFVCRSLLKARRNLVGDQQRQRHRHRQRQRHQPHRDGPLSPQARDLFFKLR